MSDSTLHICDPWTMPYLDTVGILIDALHRQIGPTHSLYKRDVFPVALRRDPDAVIFETDDEPRIYALIYLSWNPSGIMRKQRNDPKTEILSDRKAIQERTLTDNADWVAKFR